MRCEVQVVQYGRKKFSEVSNSQWVKLLASDLDHQTDTCRGPHSDDDDADSGNDDEVFLS